MMRDTRPRMRASAAPSWADALLLLSALAALCAAALAMVSIARSVQEWTNSSRRTERAWPFDDADDLDDADDADDVANDNHMSASAAPHPRKGRA